MDRLTVPDRVCPRCIPDGVGLVVNAAFWDFGDDWIVIGLILFAVTFLAGAVFFGPEAGRVGKLTAAEGPTSPVVQARIRRLLV